MAAEGQNKPISEIFLALFIMTLVLILIIEMPNWVINFSISLNITLGIVLLMISLYVQKPLELAAFPSIILIGTMFRLVLSIASTRLILAKGDAGEVVGQPPGKRQCGNPIPCGCSLRWSVTVPAGWQNCVAGSPAYAGGADRPGSDTAPVPSAGRAWKMVRVPDNSDRPHDTG